MSARRGTMYPLGRSDPGLECQVLLTCARTALTPAETARIKDLAQASVDWDAMVDLAESHGVNPLLYRSLKSACPSLVPQNVMQRIRARSRANVYRSLRFTAELFRIVSTCESHSIQAVPFKGPVLASQAYGDVALREYVDLDLLVRPSDLDTTSALFQADGYSLVSPPDHAEDEIVLRRQGSQILVELHTRIVAHWQLRRSFAVSFDDLRERLATVEMAGARSVQTLSLEDLLLVLCVHGCSHHWSRLIWIVDVAELLRSASTVDWPWLLTRARGLGAERMLLLGLRLAIELLEAKVPDKVREAVYKGSAVGRLTEQICKWLFHEQAVPIGLLDEARFFIGVRERLRDRLPCYLLYLRALFLAALEPTAEDEAFMPLPGRFRFLLFLARPFRIVAQYASAAVRRAPREQ